MNQLFKKIVFVMQLALIASFTISFVEAQAGAVDPTFNGSAFAQPSGKSYAVARQPDGKILIGGTFEVVNGFRRNSIVRINVDGTVDTSFNPPQWIAEIRAIALQSNGKILVGGKNLNGSVIARLNNDGSYDNTFVPVPGTTISPNNNGVLDIVVIAGDKFYIAGDFTYFGGVSRSKLARLNADGSDDPTFNPATNYLNIDDIEVQPDGKVLGASTSGGGTTRFLKRLNPDGTEDATFIAVFTATFLQPQQNLFAVKVQPDGKILIGGTFGAVNNTTKVNVARLNPDGSLDDGFGTVSQGTVYDIEIDINGKVVVTGYLSSFNGAPNKQVVRLENNGTSDPAFGYTDAQGYGHGGHEVLPLPDGKILVVGQKANNVFSGAWAARINADGSLDNSFSVLIGAAGAVSDIVVQADGKILVVGGFGAINSSERTRLARFNADGTADTGFNAAYLAVAVALQPDGKILVGESLPGKIFRLHPDGSRDTTFNLVLASDFYLQEIAVQPDGKIIAAGLSDNFADVVRFNQNGSPDFTFQAVQADAVVSKVVVQPDGKIIVGGNFTSLVNTRGRIARLNPDGTLDTSFNPLGGANNTVSDIGLQADGKIVIGGWFTTINGTSRAYAARLNPNGSLDTAFSPAISSVILALKIQANGKILIGGYFTTVNGVSRSRLARLNADGALDTAFEIGTGFNGTIVSALALQPNGKILVGGNFTKYNDTDKFAIVRLLNDSTARTAYDFDGDGKADISVFRPSNGAWYLLQSQNGFAGQLFGQNGDQIVPGDYDGDGKSDVAVYRGGTWYLQRSQLGFVGIAFGAADDLPVPADYDADGKTDIAVFRPSNGTWYRLNSLNNQFVAVQFGQAGDKPTLGDFDGNGEADIAVFRPSNGVWYRLNAQGQQISQNFGQSGDLVVPADYDGDGKTDIAVYRDGIWYLQRSQLGFTGIQFGDAADKPTPADYDGDGKADVAVYRPSNGVWYLLRSTQGFTGAAFGVAEDNPIPNAFVR